MASRFDAAARFLEAIQAQGIYLRDAQGHALDRDQFIAVVTKALSVLAADPGADNERTVR